MPDAAAAPAPLHLVLLPGLNGTGDLFAPFLAALPREVAATVVSYPSDRPLGYADLDGFLDDAVRDIPPHVIVAESFSGPLAVRRAARRPRGLRGLVLAATFARHPLGRRLRWLRALARPEVVIAGPARWVVRAVLANGGATPELVERVLAANLRVTPDVRARRIRETLDIDVTGLLSGLDLPVLHLAATRDRLLGRECRNELAERLPPGATLDLDGPHLLLQTRPAECAEAILRFARDCPRGE